ncbi:hypothetical protein SeMB42_g01688 [Synchytrium endobioticum]|uniref:Translin n=1 Tax=Synchytrium endobioticum TaxID=286115 RepID=A0A507DKT9_9FUNG|nr:hypothetical protein SeLEV6574_g03756 [Synchytrium endobioticum]TPX52041.1 hypothetical protein SeMB42_g01688 [Synchytrium endobioticum]
MEIDDPDPSNANESPSLLSRTNPNSNRGRPHRGRDREGGGSSYRNSNHSNPQLSQQRLSSRRGSGGASTSPSDRQRFHKTRHQPNPVVSALFTSVREALDETYDRRERIVKISRDITIHSKRMIFLLHRITASNRDEIIAEARQKQIEIIGMIKCIAPELQGSNFFRHKFAVQPGLEEYIEAVSFLVYLEREQLVTKDEINAELMDDQGPYIQITTEDYLLGLADLTGELMRLGINSLINGSPSRSLQVCHFLRQLRADYEVLDFAPARRKMNEMKNSLKKVETACYSVKVRGSEYGTQRALDLVSNDLTNDIVQYQQPVHDDEGVY